MNNYKKNLINYQNALAKIRHKEKEIFNLAKLIKEKLKSKNKIIVIGNGGSSSMSDHFATELTCKFKKKRKPFSALSLNFPSSITAWSNDFNFKTYFSRQIEAFGNKGDILLILTTSGGTKSQKSSNLFLAAKKAKKMKIDILTLSGKKRGALDKLSKIIIKVDSFETPIIQLTHQFILDQICEILEY